MKYLPQMLRRLSVMELKARELDMARRGLLQALTERDYAELAVSYHKKRIKRLEKEIEEGRA